jgi:hypothetical protein
MRRKDKHHHLRAAVTVAWHTIPEEYSSTGVRTSNLTKLKADCKRLIGRHVGGRSYFVSESLCCNCGETKENTVGLATCSCSFYQYMNGVHNILFVSLCIMCIYYSSPIIFHVTHTSTKNN